MVATPLVEVVYKPTESPGAFVVSIPIKNWPVIAIGLSKRTFVSTLFATSFLMSEILISLEDNTVPGAPLLFW